MKGKHVFVLLLILIALGVIAELFVSGSGPIIDTAAGVFAVATWIIPPLRFALAKKRTTSLAAVGFHLHVFFLAVALSTLGLLLAALTLLFSPVAKWAWPAIFGIAAFWAILVIVFAIGSRSPAPPPVAGEAEQRGTSPSPPPPSAT